MSKTFKDSKSRDMKQDGKNASKNKKIRVISSEDEEELREIFEKFNVRLK